MLPGVTRTQAVIAVLDDEPKMRKALSRLLEVNGYVVETFGTGEELLSACALRRYDCVLLDLYMPGVNGFGVLGRFAQEGLSDPIIVITGHDAPGTAERVLALGATAYLLKPLDETHLLATLDSATNSPPQTGFPDTP